MSFFPSFGFSIKYAFGRNPRSKNSKGWDRDLAVRELTSYYEFLQRLYLPSNAIEYPPEGGWPDITKESMRYEMKTDRAVDFLRHAPYLRFDDQAGGVCGGQWTILPLSHVVDYRQGEEDEDEDEDDDVEPGENYTRKSWVRIMANIGERIRHQLDILSYDIRCRFAIPPKDDTDFPYGPPIPRHIIEVAIGSRDCDCLLLDTKKGKWIFYSMMDKNWCEYSGYNLDELFELLKRRFKEMKWIPKYNYPGGMTSTRRQLSEDDTKTIMLLKMAGWPGEGDGTGSGWNRQKFDEDMRARKQLDGQGSSMVRDYDEEDDEDE